MFARAQRLSHLPDAALVLYGPPVALNRDKRLGDSRLHALTILPTTREARVPCSRPSRLARRFRSLG